MRHLLLDKATHINQSSKWNMIHLWLSSEQMLILQVSSVHLLQMQGKTFEQGLQKWSCC